VTAHQLFETGAVFILISCCLAVSKRWLELYSHSTWHRKFGDMPAFLMDCLLRLKVEVRALSYAYVTICLAALRAYQPIDWLSWSICPLLQNSIIFG
jgi:hypothetical protein